MAKNAFDNIMIKLPVTTKLVDYVLGEEGSISEVVVNDLGAVMQNDINAVNVILNCVLAAFGIDIASIARNNVELTDYRLNDMHSILLNAKWDNTDVTIKGVTKKAYEWIKAYFHIYSKENFVNSLYTRVTDCLLNANSDDVDKVILKLDMNTYLMIKLIAYCFKADHNFASVPIGESTIIPNQRYTTKEELETILKKLFVDMGLIAENTTITIPSAMWSGNDSSRAYLNQKSYATVLIHKGKCDNPLNVVYPTDPNFHEMWTYTIVTSTDPVTSLVLDGFTHTSSDTWNIDNAGSSDNKLYCWQTTFNIAIENSGTNSVFSMMKAFEIGTSENVLNLTYKNYSSFRWGDYYSGDRTMIYLPLPWKWYRLQGTATWSDIQTAQDITTDIYLNCSYSTAEDVPAPNIDDNILDDLDNLDMFMSAGFAIMTITTDAVLEALRQRANMIDTTIALKSDLVDINNGMSRVYGKPSSVIKEILEAEYLSTSGSVSIKYKNYGNLMANARQLSERTYVFAIADDVRDIDTDYDGLKNMSNFMDALFTKDTFTRFTQGLINFNPIDCVKDMFILPYSLKKNVDYSHETALMSMGGFTMDKIPYTNSVGLYRADKYVKASNLLNFFRVLRSQVVRVKIKNIEGEDVFDPVSFLNYEPYTSATIYIPFVGEMPLEMSKIIYKNVYLEYIVCQFTGDFIATVYAYDYNDTLGDGTADYYGMIGNDAVKKAYPVCQAKGNMGLKLSLIGRSTPDSVNALMGAVTSVAGNVGDVQLSKKKKDGSQTPYQLGFRPVIGSLNAGASIASAVVQSQGVMVAGGSNYDNITNLMTNWHPYITIFKHEAIRGYGTDVNTAFMQTKGKISERGIAIKHMGQGFHKCSGVKVEGLRTTAKIAQMVEEILLSGFYKSTGKEE